MAKAKAYKKKDKKLNIVKLKTEKVEVLRRTFKIENISDSTVERAGYVFESGEIKKLYGLSLSDLKEMKACKSLRIV